MNTEERIEALNKPVPGLIKDSEAELNKILQVIWNPEEKVLLRGKTNELTLLRLNVGYKSLTIQQLADSVNELRTDPALRIYGCVDYRWPTDLINMRVKFYYLGTSQIWIRIKQADLDHALLIRAIEQSKEFLIKTLETDELLIKGLGL